MAVRPSVTYAHYATSPKEQTGNIITFEKFEEGSLLSETRDYASINEESYDN